MRIFFALMFTALTASVFGQSLNPYTATERLQDEFRADPDGWHDVLMMFSDRVDILSLNESFITRDLSLSERNVELITTLKTKADAVQAPYLEAFAGSSDIRNVKPFWISNIIWAEVKGSYLAELTNDPAFEFIDTNWQPELTEYGCEDVAAPPVPNGNEPGLRAIEADEMWAMGYTGYGTIGYVIDTGVDPLHPALTDNYRGNGADVAESWLGFNNFADYPEDCDGHGTHVAGTMCGLDRSTNDTIGVAFNAEWTASPLITCNHGGGFGAGIEAFQWALDPDDNPATIDDMPDVCNNSWGQPGNDNVCNSGYESVFNALEATKIAIVFAAGNEGPGEMTVSTPQNGNQSLVNVFSVGAVSSSGNFPIGDFSSRGPTACPGEGSLKIKPEVSAPGVSVRSALPGGDYGNLQGTSMASPHVAGAILLLREAFPESTGTELKMALYMTAIDLGPAGEDNIYGMGIINVPDAFQWMIDQGHTPVAPASRENDVIAIDANIAPQNCPDNFGFDVTFENNGTETLTSLIIEYSTGASPSTKFWSGDLEPGGTETVYIDNVAINPGMRDLFITLQAPNGGTDDRPLNNTMYRLVNVENEEPLTAFPEAELGEYCSGSEVVLRMDYQDEGYVVTEWFDQPFGGSQIGEGNTITVGPLSETQTFYAEGSLRLDVGKPAPETAGTELNGNEGLGLRFDAERDFKLKSFVVYFDEPGPRQFKVETSSGETLGTKFINLEESPQVVDANFNVTAGNNHRLLLNLGSPIRVDTENVTFPYELEDIVVIERSLLGNFATVTSQYQGMYDWEVEIPHYCGRVPVEVVITDGDNVPTADFVPSKTFVNLALNDGTVDFSDASSGASDYAWNFGDGTTSTEASPTHMFTEVGVYEVSMTVLNGAGCSDAIVKEITVINDANATNVKEVFGANWDIVVFPNPTENVLNLEFNLNEAQKLSYRLVNVYGSTVTQTTERMYTSDRVSLDMSNVAAGVYYLIFAGENQKMIRKVVKM